MPDSPQKSRLFESRSGLQHFIRFAPILVMLVPLLVIIPMARVIFDWVNYVNVVPESALETTQRGYAWVEWHDVDGAIEATYVLPMGPAYQAGIREGDRFYSLDQQDYFSAELLQEATLNIPPGSMHTYQVIKPESNTILTADVRFTRYPTFLYPLSLPLWQFSIWSFTVAAFFHILGLLIVIPLAIRSGFRAGRALFSSLLILSSSLWIFGNWTRLLLVQSAGPPVGIDTAYAVVFQTLSVLSVTGWIWFPALLVRKVLGDTKLLGAGRLGRRRYAIYIPPIVLTLAALWATALGQAGPYNLDGLINPLLYYACCYVALAAGLVFVVHLVRDVSPDDVLSGWGKLGSGATLAAALAMLSLVIGIVPVLGSTPDVTAGWLIVCAQLLSLGPVILVSLVTLRRGKIDQVLRRAVVYLTLLGLFFFVFLASLELMSKYLPQFEISQKLTTALLTVVLLFLFERIIRRLGRYTSRIFATDRQLLRQEITRFQRQMGTILDTQTLAQRTADVLGEAFKARYCLLFLRPSADSSSWVSGAYHPEPPYLTQRTASQVWDALEAEQGIWSSMSEFSEVFIPRPIHQLLRERGAALVIPVLSKMRMEGLLILGAKKSRVDMYNLEDIDLMRGISGQLVLAIERLLLVEREKALVRMTAEAELKALRAQINPHFLFNALNTIAALIEERPEEAEEVVEHLAAIFRYTLNASSRSFVPLNEELKLVNHYLKIEQARFGRQLQIDKQLEAGVSSFPVPAFVIQTLVENAVKHGLERKRGTGQLKIEGCLHEDGKALITVSDSGVGIPELFNQEGPATGKEAFFGIGLGNVADRLTKLYGRDDLLQISSNPTTGTRVELTLPSEHLREPIEPTTVLSG